MSHSRKYVMQEYANSTSLNLDKSESIVKVTDMRGGNICEVEYPDGEKMLAMIPAKFRKVVWIRVGNYVVAAAPQSADVTSKVRTSIVRILTAEHVKQLKKHSLWPTQFEDEPKALTKSQEAQMENAEEDADNNSEEEQDSDDDLFVNKNRQMDDESEDDDDEDSD
eukprot:TRINITY_DN241_c0_g1_i1.p1 TRINITY_DN241_c0_g1~~TRINITY_DN241_c0_g1_i1.p1  ORF type:complete len:166 (-),score=48.07 TRINITY_DN241_c0_g1_i1:56-553(-)